VAHAGRGLNLRPGDESATSEVNFEVILLDPHMEKTKPPVDGPVVIEDFDDGWPGYEEPVFVHT
jgi:hypothetical protein